MRRMEKRKPFSMNYLDSLGPTNPRSWHNTISRTKTAGGAGAGRMMTTTNEDFQRKRSTTNNLSSYMKTAKRNREILQDREHKLVSRMIGNIDRSIRRYLIENEGFGYPEEILCSKRTWVNFLSMREALLESIDAGSNDNLINSIKC